MKVRSTATKGRWKLLLKACFPNVYRGDNYIACYNFYQKCKDYFAIARAKDLIEYLLQYLFCEIVSVSADNSTSGS